MLSRQRLAANRRNAQLSTGPRTQSGKSTSSANGLKTGIHSNRLLLPGDDASFLARVRHAWHTKYPGPTPAESRLIQTQIHSYWLLQRLARIESGLKEQEAASVLRTAVQTLRSLQIGGNRRSRELRAAAHRNDQFMQIARRREVLSRDFHNAQYELNELRASAESEPAAPAQLQQNVTPVIEMGPFLRKTFSPESCEPVAEL